MDGSSTTLSIVRVSLGSDTFIPYRAPCLRFPDGSIASIINTFEILAGLYVSVGEFAADIMNLFVAFAPLRI